MSEQSTMVAGELDTLRARADERRRRDSMFANLDDLQRRQDLFNALKTAGETVIVNEHLFADGGLAFIRATRDVLEEINRTPIRTQDVR